MSSLPQVLEGLPGTPEDPFGGCRVDLNAMGWALAAVSSRAFRTRGPAHPAAMLPLVDMANHSFDPNVEVLPVEGGVGLFARKKVGGGRGGRGFCRWWVVACIRRDPAVNAASRRL